MKHLFFLAIMVIFLGILGACGFTSQEDYLKQRANYRQDCQALQLSDRQSFNNQNAGSIRQTYFVDLPKDKNGIVHRVNHSFLDNNNYMNRIAFNKNMRKRSCSDAYFRDVTILGNKSPQK